MYDRGNSVILIKQFKKLQHLSFAFNYASVDL